MSGDLARRAASPSRSLVAAGDAAVLGRQQLLRQHRHPDPDLCGLRARAQRAGRLWRARLARPCRPVRRRRLYGGAAARHSGTATRCAIWRRSCSTLAVAAVFAVLALRATGIGFLMITLALGQILWGIAYRWASLTNGDNGVNVSGAPEPVRHQPGQRAGFYWATLVVFLVARRRRWRLFVRSPFGASLRGTRDQPRRMTRARLQCLADPLPGLPVLRLLERRRRAAVRLLQPVHQPAGGGAADVGRGAADGDLRRHRRPCSARSSAPPSWSSMKNIVSAYVERWNMVLGVIFVADHHRSCRKVWCRARRGCGAAAGWRKRRPTTAPRRRRRVSCRASACRRAGERARRSREPQQVVRRPARHAERQPRGRARRAPPDHRPERRRQDHAVQPDHRRTSPDAGAVIAVRRRTSRACRAGRRAHLGLARTYQIITLFPRDTILRNVTLALLGLSPAALEPVRRRSTAQHRSDRRGARRAGARRPRAHRRRGRWRETSYGERRRVEIAMALAQNPKVLLLDEPFAGLSIEERRDVRKLLAGDPARRHHRDDRARHGRGARLRRPHHAAAFRRGDRRGHPRRGGGRSAHPGGLSWRLARCSARGRRLLRRQPCAARRVVRARRRAPARPARPQRRRQVDLHERRPSAWCRRARGDGRGVRRAR